MKWQWKKNKAFDCHFNEGGCNNPDCKCFHKYCDKFKWIIERVNHYAEKLNIPASEILDTVVPVDDICLDVSGVVCIEGKEVED